MTLDAKAHPLPGGSGFFDSSAPAGLRASLSSFLVDEFQFGAPDCPGLKFWGAIAEIDPAGCDPNRYRINAAGSGLSAHEAETKCLGEVAERLCTVRQGADGVTAVPYGEIPAALWSFLAERDPAASVDCLHGLDIRSGEPVWLPVELCLHDDAAGAPRIARGVAAGPSFEYALDAALCEVVERDAAALWWLGARPPSLPILEQQSAATITDTISGLRKGAVGRQSWLLDISCDTSLPVAAAVSTQMDGEGFACGLGAAPTFAEAARSALVEMAQMELSLHVIRGKARSLGVDGLTAADHQQIHRTMAISTATCPLILPSAPPRPMSQMPGEDGTQAASITNLISSHSPLYVSDLTRAAIGVPAAVVLAPALQPLNADVETDRLAQVSAQSGGGAQYHGGIPLI